MAKKTYVLDTSIAIKWCAEEPDSPDALLLRNQLDKGLIILTAPDLIFYELANALRWNKNFNETDVVRALASFRVLGIQVFLPRPELIENAINLAFRHHCTIYDAIFLALARKIKCQLLTADEKLAKAAGDAVQLKDVV